ncbi:MAG: sugar nucleotide-binding protein [Flavisolibacter sp.]|nr:sugar nucleotide-binding protein [Flavisolibacter sp.]
MDKRKRYCNPEIWGGIECTINRIGDKYYDQLVNADVYRHPHIEAIIDLGIKKVRFPVLWEKHQPTMETEIDWSWPEKQLNRFREANIDVIAGLVHHGSGPAITNLLDDHFPFLLAEYAKQVAIKFPWIKYYTPVNEPLTTARFSGLYGLWYPHKSDDKSFVRMLLNELKGVVLAMQEMRKINPAVQLIQTEDLAKTYSTPLLQYQADFENERRWLTFDLLCGRVNKDHPLWPYFRWIGIPEDKLLFFQENNCPPDIFGFNHYLTSERYLDEKIHLYPPHTHSGNGQHVYADVEAVRIDIDEETGIKVLLQDAWNRFKKPIAITEVHLHCHREEQLRWFRFIWENCSELLNRGMPIMGVTAWALFGSYGWNRLLTLRDGDYEPGVFDLRGGQFRPTALERYIKQVCGQNKCDHILTDSTGWWQRDCRYLHEPVIPKKMKEQTASDNQKPILIIGKRGTLGRAFAKICDHRSISYQLLSREQCDIAELPNIESAIDFYKPWAIVNAAGYLRVDDAEIEKEQCFRENQIGPANLATACKKYGIKLVTFSTDLVFDGKKRTPYVESDVPSPLNVYGRSKALSEEQIKQIDESALIIRTSAFFGPWDRYNFIHWITQNLTHEQIIPVANDVYISPTYVPDLVHTSLDLLIDDEKGIWHLTNEGAITWADLAYETAERYHLSNTFINAIPLADLHLPAVRPYYSVLGSEKAYLLPPLENALHRFFNEKPLPVTS